ncbi:nuclear transport factor 2 family protein [Streptomyces cavernicola]|uniref:Nuclear transport factor 2 family protein n=1 Tax=Streptomyces cavernicola TaxID=3043613 RepID=A0ABT6S737_9ACTN|nr:nuclear transport factor 2 family protein [Streptomyces sp. B-S-A6]MDI3403830.1 nuclear transport factor 2 family protein [Streptomyces sp. B-S-A6]
MDDIFPAEALIGAERRLAAAVLALDVDALDRMLHPQFVSVRPDGRSLDRSEEIRELTTGRLVVTELAPEETLATVNGRAGITRRTLTAAGEWLGTPFHARVLCTRTWVQVPGGWLVLLSRVGPAPDEPELDPKCGVRLTARC